MSTAAIPTYSVTPTRSGPSSLCPVGCYSRRVNGFWATLCTVAVTGELSFSDLLVRRTGL